MKRKTFQRRIYETTAMVAVRERRQLVLFWARRCHKSTTLGNIAFDEMAGEPGRTVIAASASLLLGKELVGFALSATEMAAQVLTEAKAVRTVFEQGANSKDLNFKVADCSRDKVLNGLTDDDFAELYKSSNMELRLYFDKTTYSRLKVIAPNPATARGWGGTVLRDEAGYTPVALENDLRVATKPIIDTDPTFKLIYACNLCPNDRHPFFEMTMPPPDMNFTPDPAGHFYIGQNGILIHRVSLADAYAAGHVLYDDQGKPLTYEQFIRNPANKLGLPINYTLVHEAGGTAAIDLIALLTAQRRGAAGCSFVFVDSDADWQRALQLLRANLGPGKVTVGMDVATTTGETSNPTSITTTEKIGNERWQRLVAVFKTKKRQVMKARLEDICRVVRERPSGGPVARLGIDATSERLAAEETADDLRGIVPVQLVIASNTVDPAPPGYDVERDGAPNYKTYLGDTYSQAVNDNRYAMPCDDYLKMDQRLPMKDAGKFVCTPDPDGKHGDTFDSGKIAEFMMAQGGPVQSSPVPNLPNSNHVGSLGMGRMKAEVAL